MLIMVEELVARTAWDRRPDELSALRVLEPSHLAPHGEPAMLFGPLTVGGTWNDVCAAWRSLPEHECLLRPLSVETSHSGSVKLWLRYAPLDWQRDHWTDDGDAGRALLARWGAQLADFFYTISGQPLERLRYLANPVVMVDVTLGVRVAFLPPKSPTFFDEVGVEAGLVRLVGESLRVLGKFGFRSPMAKLVEQWRKGKTRSLGDVLRACRKLANTDVGESSRILHSRENIERGLGWLALRDPARGLEEFKAAKTKMSNPLIEWGLRTCAKQLPVDSEEGFAKANAPAGDAAPSAALPGFDWSTRVKWEDRSPEFGALARVDINGSWIAAMHLLVAPSDETLTFWRMLPRHPNLLRPIEKPDPERCLLEYAALDWNWVPPDDVFPIDGWVAQLVAVFKAIVDRLPPTQWRWFTRPFVMIDIGGQLRVGFLPPEHTTEGVTYDERDLVHVVGRALEALWLPLREKATDSQRVLTDVRIATCIDPVQEHAYDSLNHVTAAFASVPKSRELVRGGPRLAAWRQLEQGIGFVLQERYEEALLAFHAALQLRPMPAAEFGVALCRRVLGIREPQTSWAKSHLVWFQIRSEIAKLEAERAFKEAIALYARVLITDADRAEVFAGRARCHLESRDTGPAIDYARQALTADPTLAGARIVLIRALIEHRLHAEALTEADAWLQSDTHDATAHYLRGKALIGLARLEDARDAFDLALVLRPTMIEAMLLRREADRTLAKLGKSVGQQHTTVVVPAALEPLRDILLSGRIKDVINALSSPGYAAEPDAQLMLARFHTFDRSYGRAAELYDRVLESSPEHRHTALVGKATVLLEQGRYESALAMFDALLGEDSRDLEACEGRARTLDKLGRVGEAAAEFRRFVSLADAGAKLRVRVAQLWLDQH